MKQSDDPRAFLEKYGFTRSASQPHPVYRDTMYFEGLEAEFVSRLEVELDHFKKAYFESIQRNESYHSRELYRMRDEIEKNKRKEST